MSVDTMRPRTRMKATGTRLWGASAAAAGRRRSRGAASATREKTSAYRRLQRGGKGPWASDSCTSCLLLHKKVQKILVMHYQVAINLYMRCATYSVPDAR